MGIFQIFIKFDHQQIVFVKQSAFVQMKCNSSSIFNLNLTFKKNWSRIMHFLSSSNHIYEYFLDLVDGQNKKSLGQYHMLIGMIISIAQGGTNSEESSKPDLILYFILKVHILRFLRHSRLKCCRASFFGAKTLFLALKTRQ